MDLQGFLKGIPGFVVVAALGFGASAAELAPHRAIYDMRLAVAKPGSTILDVRGAMVIEMGESCDGWETTQRMRLTFSRADTEQVESDYSFASFESKDGLNYRFTVRNIEDGSPDEQLRGTATFENGRGNGRAVFNEPQRREFALPRGTMFPTAHTAALIDKAQAGDFAFLVPVFDGARVEGAYDVNALITGVGKEMEPAPKHELIDGQKAWSVHLAFFPPSRAQEAPEFELAADLLANGVARSMLLDYGDFSVRASLASIQQLPRPKCK